MPHVSAPDEPAGLPSVTDPTALKRHFLDRHRTTTDARTLNAVARMVLEIDCGDDVMATGLAHLADALDSDRVDAGFGCARDHTYRPTAEHCERGAVSMVGRPLPNGHASLQTVWRNTAPLAVNDVQTHALFTSIRDDLQAVGSEAMLIQRLSVAGRGIGLVCVDDLERARRWTRHDRQTIRRFCDDFFAPLLHLSRTPSQPAPLSAAELAAVRGASQGLSYKQIAARLGKSVRTVEHQLRSARRKTGAANQVDLVQACRPWL